MVRSNSENLKSVDLKKTADFGDKQHKSQRIRQQETSLSPKGFENVTEESSDQKSVGGLDLDDVV